MRRFTVGSLGDRQARRIAPKIFERIERAFLGVKDVHEDIVVIDDDPLAEWASVHIMRAQRVFVPHFVFDLRGDGFEMRLRSAGADDEEIGQRRDPAQIEHEDILRLFIGGVFRTEPGDALRGEGFLLSGRGGFAQ